jgi:hypothetical protein
MKLHILKSKRGLAALSAIILTYGSSNSVAGRLYNAESNISSLADGWDEPKIGDATNGDLAAPNTPAPNIYTPPAGTVLNRTLGTSCVELTKNSTTWTDVFGTDISLTTGAATSLIEVNFSSQAAVSGGQVDLRLDMRCQVSQDAGTTFNSCSGQNTTNGVIFARRIKSNDGTNTFQGTTNPGTYIGFYPNTLPSQATLIRLQVRNRVADSAASASSSFVCFPNVIIRY